MLDGWGKLGEALGDYNGKKVFVFGGIDGEEVIAEVIKEHRRYIAARVVEIISKSKYRIDAPCKYFGECTGCQWQHILYEYQLKLKKEIIQKAFRVVCDGSSAIVRDTIQSPGIFGYRNHARFTSRDGSLGFVNRSTRKFIPVSQCIVMHDGINKAIELLQGHCSETTHLSIRYGVNTGDCLIQPALRNPAIACVSGQSTYTEKLKDRVFRVGSPSFFQINTVQAENLIDIILDKLNLTGNEVLVDVYCGVGTFTISLCEYVDRAIGIEESAASINDAIANGAGLDGIEFIKGKAEDVLDRMSSSPDVIIIDPPRSGCSLQTLESLARLSPKRIVYVSCDPWTLARDTKILCDMGFVVDEIQPVDLFPQTHHVECIAIFSFQSNDLPFILASQSPRRRILLDDVGVEFSVVRPDVREMICVGETPEEFVMRLATEKAMSIASKHDAILIAADTVVVYEDMILGKPASHVEAADTLKLLRGKYHRVITGVSIVDSRSNKMRVMYKVSRILMRNYDDQEIDAYVVSGEAMDKAGAYGIQDKVFDPVKIVIGCYNNVVGLPTCVLYEMLSVFGKKIKRPVIAEDGNSCDLCRLSENKRWDS